MITPELLKRIAYAKYLFWQGCESLDKKLPIADGMAVLCFQDATEMVLRTIGEYFDTNIKDNAAFNQIINEIENIPNKSIPNKHSLIQLNKARVNFKHYGLMPNKDDVIKFKKDLDIFFIEVTKIFLNLDFHQVSLVDLIESQRLKNYLKKSELKLSKDNYKESIFNSAIAFSLVFPKVSKFQRGININRSFGFENRHSINVIENFNEIINEIMEELFIHQEQLNVLKFNINFADYQRFRFIAPEIFWSAAETFKVMPKHPDDKIYNLENSRFCFCFVTDAALLIQNSGLTKKNHPIHKFPQYRVIKKGSIVVAPKTQNPENIRDVDVGEILIGYYERHNIEGYIAILQDDEKAYIEEDAVEKIK